MNTIECHICCNEFDECKHRPRILSCGHTFCSICLKSLLNDGRITCPNCQKPHVTEKIEHININFLIESILSPGDKDKTVAFDTGFKCNEHYYEQNFFCETHKEWICRDCTVIQHKPCSHSKDCDNENDCRVITKKEKLEEIKSVKIRSLKSHSKIHGDVLKNRVTECESKLNSKLLVRKDLQTRLKVVEEQNDSEIDVLMKRLNSLKDILKNVEANDTFTLVVQQEMSKAQGRVAIEESSRNIDKVIKSAKAWNANDLASIKEKENITEVQIALKEFDDVKLKLCQTEKNLCDSKAEHESNANQLKLQLKQSKEKTLALENELKLKLSKTEKYVHDSKVEHELTTNQLKLQLKLCEEKKLAKKIELTALTLKLNKTEKELHDSKVEKESITNQFKSYLRQCEERTLALENELKKKDNKLKKKDNKSKDNSMETQDIYEVVTFVENTEVYLKGPTKEGRLGKLDLLSYDMKKYILLEAFGISNSTPGSMELKCRPMLEGLQSLDFVYLDIGKIQSTEDGIELIGSPFGRLYIQLTCGPNRREQMIDICSSKDDEKWRFCSFTTIRNKSGPGELVTCKYFRDANGSFSDDLYNNLEYDSMQHLISGGKVFGYNNDAAGFSIITRHKYNCYTSWPLLGEVVIGLDILKEAVNNHDVSNIGIHSHGVGFPI